MKRKQVLWVGKYKVVVWQWAFFQSEVVARSREDLGSWILRILDIGYCAGTVRSLVVDQRLRPLEAQLITRCGLNKKIRPSLLLTNHMLETLYFKAIYFTDPNGNPIHYFSFNSNKK